MLYPNLSGLSLLCPTGADEDAGGGPPLHSAARDDVLSNDELVAMIMANIRDEDGSPEAVCRMVEVWCRKLSKFNCNACEGADSDANPELWRQLCDRVFPNWRQEVFPPSKKPETPELGRFIQKERFMHQPQGEPTVRTEHLPWSGVPTSKSWKEWFYILCATYLRRRGNLREYVAQQARRRRDHRRNVHALRAQLEAMEAPRRGGPNEPPDVRHAKQVAKQQRRLEDEEGHRQRANFWLSRGGPELKKLEDEHGRTADHKEYAKTPAYAPPVEPPAGPEYAETEPDSDYDYDTDEERDLDRRWGVPPVSDEEEPPAAAGPNAFGDGYGDTDTDTNDEEEGAAL